MEIDHDVRAFYLDHLYRLPMDKETKSLLIDSKEASILNLNFNDPRFRHFNLIILKAFPDQKELKLESNDSIRWLSVFFSGLQNLDYFTDRFLNLTPRLSILDINPNNNILRPFPFLPNLTKVTLLDGPVSMSFFDNLVEARYFETLILNNCNIEGYIKSLPSIKNLFMYGFSLQSHIKRDNTAFFKTFPNLRNLRIAETRDNQLRTRGLIDQMEEDEEETYFSLSRLIYLPSSLENLYYLNYEDNEDRVDIFNELPNLKLLYFGTSTIYQSENKAIMTAIEKMPKLEGLHFEGDFTFDQIEKIGEMKYLNQLSLDHIFRDEELIFLLNRLNLISLRLRFTNLLTDRAFGLIGQQKNLKWLSLTFQSNQQLKRVCRSESIEYFEPLFDFKGLDQDFLILKEMKNLFFLNYQDPKREKEIAQLFRQHPALKLWGRTDPDNGFLNFGFLEDQAVEDHIKLKFDTLPKETILQEKFEVYLKEKDQILFDFLSNGIIPTVKRYLKPQPVEPQLNPLNIRLHD